MGTPRVSLFEPVPKSCCCGFYWPNPGRPQEAVLQVAAPRPGAGTCPPPPLASPPRDPPRARGLVPAPSCSCRARGGPGRGCWAPGADGAPQLSARARRAQAHWQTGAVQRARGATARRGLRPSAQHLRSHDVIVYAYVSASPMRLHQRHACVKVNVCVIVSVSASACVICVSVYVYVSVASVSICCCVCVNVHTTPVSPSPPSLHLCLCPLAVGTCVYIRLSLRTSLRPSQSQRRRRCRVAFHVHV